MTLIGDAAFFECESMTEFTFPASLTEIGQGAFVSTGFKTIEIPATVISIGYSAFGFTTDQTHEIIAVDGFSISGYSGSYAQSYCTENGIEFIEIEPANTDTGKNSSESKVKPGVVISICIVCRGYYNRCDCICQKSQKTMIMTTKMKAITTITRMTVKKVKIMETNK